jgi:hypothetical protein
MDWMDLELAAPSSKIASGRAPSRALAASLTVLAVAAATVLGCSSAPTLETGGAGEDLGTVGEALSCGPSEGNWADFPEGNGTQQCVAGVDIFYQAKFGAHIPPASGSYGNCAYEGACNIWANPADRPSSAVWERHDWGSEEAQTYDLVVFPPVGGDPWGHIASVDHMSGGTLYVMDSNWGETGRKAVCVHTVGGYVPYGFYRLKALAAPPPKPVKGSLDSASCSAISGWAQDPGSASTALAVDLYVDGPAGTGTPIGRFTAGTSRADLCSAIGSCDHAFSVPTPANLLDGTEHSIYAYGIAVTSGVNNELLSQSPATLHCAATLTGDFQGTGLTEVVQYRDDWSTLPSCGRWGSDWSCSNDTATYVGGEGAGNAGAGVYPGSTALVGDMNGDGRDDIIQWNNTGSTIPVCLSVAHGWACENLNATYVGGLGGGNSGSGVYPGATPFIADVNGDGKADLVQFVPGAESIPVCFGTADGWSCENLAATYLGGNAAGNGGSGVYGSAFGKGTTALVADVNGDGKADLVQYNPAWATVPVCFSTGHGWSCENLSTEYVGGAGAGNAGSGVFAGSTPRLADVNGDGKADLIQYNGSSATLPVCILTGHGWTCEALAATYVGGIGAGNSGSGIYGATTLIVADVNGDGNADLVQYAQGWTSIPVCFSTGRGWSCENLGADAGDGKAAPSALPNGSTVTGNFSGGKTLDLIQMSPESDAKTLPFCALTRSQWTCSNDSAAVY